MSNSPGKIMSVCLSVSPSHAGTCRPAVDTAEHILILPPPFLFFPYQTLWQYSDGDPLTGGVEYKLV